MELTTPAFLVAWALAGGAAIAVFLHNPFYTRRIACWGDSQNGGR